MYSIREVIARYDREHHVERESPLRVIDLSCGAGGMSEGFRQMGFLPVWANDFNQDAARTYRANFGDHCTAGDIVTFLEHHADEVPAADVVVGGVSCVSFSSKAYVL